MAGAQSFSSVILPPNPSTFSAISTQLSPFYVAQNFLLAILPLLSLLVYLIYQDYLSFLALGPGGTPYNFYGYSKITFLRLFALRDPYVPHAVPEGLQHSGFLPKNGIPKRDSLRPTVTGIAPHRQVDQRPSSDVFLCLSGAIEALAESCPRRLRMGISSFEKHCAGLFSKTQVNRTCNGEVAHVHPSDCSMHITLHPADAKVVIEAGWGERHPLARGGWFTRFVPQGFVMVYAPRTREEIPLIMTIIKAGFGWVNGEALDESEAVSCAADK